MNEDEAKTLIRQILDCDKVIHEQVLSIPWTSPSAEAMDVPGEGQSETGTQTGRVLGVFWLEWGGGGVLCVGRFVCVEMICIFFRNILKYSKIFR